MPITFVVKPFEVVTASEVMVITSLEVIKTMDSIVVVATAVME